MKRTVTRWEFRDAFRDYERNDSFSYEGLGALFDYLEDDEENSGIETEMDVISLCCNFSEHASCLDCVNDLGYPLEIEDDWNDEEKEDAAREYLQENTTLIEFDGGVIIQGF